MGVVPSRAERPPTRRRILPARPGRRREPPTGHTDGGDPQAREPRRAASSRCAGTAQEGVRRQPGKARTPRAAPLGPVGHRKLCWEPSPAWATYGPRSLHDCTYSPFLRTPLLASDGSLVEIVLPSRPISPSHHWCLPPEHARPSAGSGGASGASPTAARSRAGCAGDRAVPDAGRPAGAPGLAGTAGG